MLGSAVVPGASKVRGYAAANKLRAERHPVRRARWSLSDGENYLLADLGGLGHALFQEQVQMLDKTTGQALYHVKFLAAKREERSVKEMVARHGANRDGSVPHIRWLIANGFTPR